jgi:Na+-driven multidrug efflux pump
MDPHSESNSRLKVFLENPSKALWTLAIPIMFGMGIQTLYNLVDMIFIGKLGGQTDHQVSPLTCRCFFWS